MSTLLPQLQHAPDHTIILYGSISQDTTGKRFIPATQSLPMVVGAANAPIFVLGDVLVGQGSVGGYVSSYATQGRLAAGDAMKILGGEKPQNIPIASGANTYLFDWRALKRWDLKERNLPVGSIVLNRQPTLMEQYGRYVSIGLLLLFAQLILILDLLRQRAKERLIRRHLRESEALLREAQSIAQCGSWVWKLTENKTYWSDEMYCIMGLVPQSVTPTNGPDISGLRSVLYRQNDAGGGYQAALSCRAPYRATRWRRTNCFGDRTPQIRLTTKTCFHGRYPA